MAAPFTYEAAGGDGTVPLLDRSATLLAGGTDLVPLMHQSLVSPTRLVDLKPDALPRGIETTETGWTIGALCTLAELEDHQDLSNRMPVIAQAVAQAATRQLRHRATVGGNLLQRARCSYYRDATVDCWLKGGDSCPAREGRNQHHAIFGNGPCVAVQPSDLASALVAADAVVHLELGEAQRAVPVGDLLAAPTAERRSLNSLGDGEVITSVRIPIDGTNRSSYVKVMDRAAWAFALVGLAGVAHVDDEQTVRSARLVATGVAGAPWRLSAAEEALIGRSLSDARTTEAVTRRVSDGARPLSDNGYKVPMLEGVTRRMLAGLTG